MAAMRRLCLARRRARPRQRPVHRPRRWRLRPRGQPARQPHRALRLEGHRRAHGGAGDPGGAGSATWPTWAGRTGCCPPPGFVAVKAPVFSTTKLRGVDPIAGTRHAVDGRGHRPARGRRRGLAKALLAASLRPPFPGTEADAALISMAPNATCRACPSSPRHLARRRLSLRRDAGHGGGPARAGPRGPRGGPPRIDDDGACRSILDVIASGRCRARHQHALRRGPARSSRRPPSATPRSPKASSA